MKRRLLPAALTATLATALAACSGPAEPQERAAAPTPKPERTMSATNAHTIAFNGIDGSDMPFEQFAGKAVLVVNTASRCGYTPQYEGLQQLYETMKDDGLVVLGAPSNDFGGQEPGTEAEVKTFCEINYGVTFPLTAKVSTTTHDFWKAAVDALGEPAQPQWNFHKVLVGPDGTFLKAYPSATSPADTELVADIEAALES